MRMHRKSICDIVDMLIGFEFQSSDCEKGKFAMKYIRQFGIILGITLMAELLESVIKLPIPASIYGLVIMFLLLAGGGIKIHQVKEAADFLIEIMPLMFIPAAVGLMESYGELEGILVPVIVAVIVTTVVVMAVTGRCAQWMLRKKHGAGTEERKDNS